MAEDKEIAAMSAIAKALDALPEEDREVRERVLLWACSRYQVSPVSAKRAAASRDSDGSKDSEDTEGAEQGSFADLYNEAEPDTDVDRALLAGYWLGKGATREEFTAINANRELKNLGHPVGNITDSMQALIDRRPALVMQTAKSGSSKQARKKYKLTIAGVNAVAEMTR